MGGLEFAGLELGANEFLLKAGERVGKMMHMDMAVDDGDVVRTLVGVFAVAVGDGAGVEPEMMGREVMDGGQMGVAEDETEWRVGRRQVIALVDEGIKGGGGVEGVVAGVKVGHGVGDGVDRKLEGLGEGFEEGDFIGVEEGGVVVTPGAFVRGDGVIGFRDVASAGGVEFLPGGGDGGVVVALNGGDFVVADEGEDFTGEGAVLDEIAGAVDDVGIGFFLADGFEGDDVGVDVGEDEGFHRFSRRIRRRQVCR